MKVHDLPVSRAIARAAMLRSAQQPICPCLQLGAGSCICTAEAAVLMQSTAHVCKSFGVGYQALLVSRILDLGSSKAGVAAYSFYCPVTKP